eukprot:2298982-Rhodomonas_salina.2
MSLGTTMSTNSNTNCSIRGYGAVPTRKPVLTKLSSKFLASGTLGHNVHQPSPCHSWNSALCGVGTAVWQL